MNKLLLGILLFFTITFVSVSCEKEKIVGLDDLPATGTTFLKEHFNNVAILSVTKEKEGLSGTEYKVLLDNRTEVTFDKNGNWKEVDAADNIAIRTTFILPAIVNYVNTNYPNADFNSIERENGNFDVELTNGLDLVFNKQGDFVRIDP